VKDDCSVGSFQTISYLSDILNLIYPRGMKKISNFFPTILKGFNVWDYSRDSCVGHWCTV
jgi:hypothetical protein